MQGPLSRVSLIALAAVAVVASACSSSPSATTATTTTRPKTTTNTGLCKLVVPSIVATALEESMNYPVTQTQGTVTQCAYRGVHSATDAVIIRYETNTNATDFDKRRAAYEHRGLKLGPITGLGDQAYYFAEAVGGTTVTTVVVLRDSLQVLVTGTAALDPIGSIARYTLSQYLETHEAPSSSTSSSTSAPSTTVAN